MKKKKSITKNNTLEEKEVKNRTVEAHYDWSKMAQLLRNSTCRSIERFYLSMGIPKQTYYDAVKRDPIMREAHDFALERIGCDREEYCWDQKLSSNSIIGLSLPQFLNRWKDDTEWRAKLKQLEEEKNQNITVVMESFKKDKE